MEVAGNYSPFWVQTVVMGLRIAVSIVLAEKDVIVIKANKEDETTDTTENVLLDIMDKLYVRLNNCLVLLRNV